SRSVFQRPQTMIDERRQLCDEYSDRLQRSVRLLHERLQQKLASTAASLDALSPLKVLGRGYSLTTTVDGRLLRSVSDVTVGDQISTRFVDGNILSEVVRD
ncbi:MAG: exodeoxyribonuclease VII large subunit, partial [Planctomycetaceae bacterium]